MNSSAVRPDDSLAGSPRTTTADAGPAARGVERLPSPATSQSAVARHLRPAGEPQRLIPAAQKAATDGAAPTRSRTLPHSFSRRRSVLLPVASVLKHGEDAKAYRRLRRSLMHQYRPDSEEQVRCLDGLAVAYWRLRRATCAESIHANSASWSGDDLRLVLKYRADAAREIRELTRELKALQAARQKES